MIDASKFGFIPIQNKKEKSKEKEKEKEIDYIITVQIEKKKINDLQRYLVVRKVIQNRKPCKCNKICKYKELIFKYNKMYNYNEFVFNELCR